MSTWTLTPLIKKAVHGVPPGAKVCLSPDFLRMLRRELAANRGTDALLCRSTFAFNDRLFSADPNVPDGRIAASGRTLDVLSGMTRNERAAFLIRPKTEQKPCTSADPGPTDSP